MVRTTSNRKAWVFAAAALAVGILGWESVPSAQIKPVRINRIIDRLVAGKVAIGTATPDSSFEMAQKMAKSDRDYVFLEMEHHGSLDAPSLRAFLLGLNNKIEMAKNGNLQSMASMVMMGNEPTELMKQALDVGAMSVMFMAVNNKEQALRNVQAMRFPHKKAAADRLPLGRRVIGPPNAAWLWGLTPADYMVKADLWPLDPNGELLAVMEIETVDGLSNIEEIAQVPGVGGIFIGPGDLARAMELDNQNPALEVASQRILAACLKYNVACGIGVRTERTVRSAQNFLPIEVRTKQGFKLLDPHDEP